MNKHLLYICIMFLASSVYSQTEDFFISAHNDTIIKTRQSGARLKSFQSALPYTSLLTLPFFDDFARPGIFPYQGHWADQNVFVNNCFAIMPPSIFVATFDALGPDGLLYSNASTSEFAADTLTSLPFNLKNRPSGAPSDNLYIINRAASKTNDTVYSNIGDSLYYKSDTTYYLLKSTYIYHPSDTLYIQKVLNNVITYAAGTDSIYTNINGNYSYIQDSKHHKNTITNYLKTDGAFLSFYVQPGGLGSMPDNADSLTLEFYAPEDNEGIFINEVAIDWLEIYNATDSVVDIAQFYLFNDTISNIRNDLDTSKTIHFSDFQIINDGSITTKIPPFGFITIPPSACNAYKNFVSKTFMLYDKNQKLVDGVINQDTSLLKTSSYGRLNDGGKSDTLATMGIPSKGKENGGWLQQWAVSSNQCFQDSFSLYRLPINSNYLRRGFRFRFINYCSLSSDPSHARSEDQWNLDNVYVNYDTTRLNPPADFELRQVIANFLGDYSAIPHRHLDSLTEDMINSSIASYTFENTDVLGRKVTPYVKIEEILTNKKLTDKIYNYFDTKSLTTVSNFHNFKPQIDLYDYFRTTIKNTYSDFLITFYFTDVSSTFHEMFRWNDTMRLRQSFYNYYAYDDGSAEAGWGIRGADQAQVAYKFTTLKTDTLRSIEMYFNNTLLSTPPMFNLCVWNDNNGVPGEMIYEEAGLTPNYSNGLNGFSLYTLDTSLVIDKKHYKSLILSGTFYVGWTQPQDVLLNIGVDLNNIIKQKLFYKVDQDWTAALLTKPIMIRPVFDSNPMVINDVNNTAPSNNNITLFPNPSSGKFTIDVPDNYTIDVFHVVITNTYGSTVMESSEKTIDASPLPAGMYFISITNAKDCNKMAKLIISK